jgi:glycosyltransferase involved in cell wall biosynthesis
MTTPLDVLYVVPQGEVGGAERFLDSVLRHHDRDRVRPIVAALTDGPWLPELRARDIPAYHLPGLRVSRPIACYRSFAPIIRRHRVRVVHSSSSWVHALVAPAAVRHGCRTVVFNHGPVRPRRWQGVLALVPADLLIANSRFLRDRLAGTWHGARAVDVVHLELDAVQFAADEQRRRSFRRQWGVPDGTMAVGLVSFIDVSKGHDVLIEAAALLRDHHRALRFFLIGGPRGGLVHDRCIAFEARLRALVRERRLDHLVSFTGPLDIRAGALDGLDVVVLPTTEPDAFGMVLVEGMANGKVVVASAEGGPVEIITHDRDGVLVPPRSPEALAGALAGLVNDRSRRDRLAAEGYRTVSATFGAGSAARKLESRYEDLVRQPAGSARSDSMAGWSRLRSRCAVARSR